MTSAVSAPSPLSTPLMGLSGLARRLRRGACVAALLAGFATLGFAALGSLSAASASPATDSDFMDINDGVANVNLSTSYQTARVFRGVRQADDVMKLELKTTLGAGPAALDIGIGSFLPFANQNSGIEEPNEVFGYGLARFDLGGIVQAEAGVTYYSYPGAEDIPGSEPDSLEFLAGARLPVLIPLFARAYYDVEYRNTTVELGTEWRQDTIGKLLALELHGKAGYVNSGDNNDNINAALAGARTLVQDEPALASGLNAKDNRFYYEAGAAVSSQLNKNFKVGANLNWAGTTGEYIFDNARDDEVLWGGVTLTAGL